MAQRRKHRNCGGSGWQHWLQLFMAAATSIAAVAKLIAAIKGSGPAL
jgi:hypothetical protein